MLILGHVGFTLGAVALLRRKYCGSSSSLSQLARWAGIALLPDIVDRSLSLIFPFYPDHCCFHSLILYVAAFVLVTRFRPRLTPYLAIMMFNVVLDLANVDPRALLFPLFTKADWMSRGMTLSAPVMARWPSHLAATDREGHYLVFELLGIIPVVWTLWSAVAHVVSRRT